MQETSTSPTTILQFRQDIETQFRRHIREALDLAALVRGNKCSSRPWPS